MKKSVLAILAVAFASGCAGVPVYKKIEASLARQQFDQAAMQVEKSKGEYSKRSQLVYYMDRILTSHLAGRYEESNRFVELAHDRIEELYTKSISGEAMSWILNDSKKDYRGEHFERVMVHLFGMLNYSMLGRPDEALVEARRADLRLRRYAEKYGDDLRYKDDALVRWLSGLVYESRNELSDAFIDYKKALEAYEWYGQAYGTATPTQAIKDAIRMADRLDELEQAGRLRKKYPGVTVEETPAYLRRKGEAIILVYEGFAPQKQTEYWQVPLEDSDGRVQIFKVAYPHFVSETMPLDEGYVEDSKGKRHKIELFEDVDAIAVKDLDDRMGKIKLKAIARATIKFKASMEVQKEAKNKLLAAVATNLFSAITEQADTRSWRTLPGRIHAVRIPLEAGEHDLKVILKRHSGDSFEKLFPAVKVERGKQVFLRVSLY